MNIERKNSELKQIGRKGRTARQTKDRDAEKPRNNKKTTYDTQLNKNQKSKSESGKVKTINKKERERKEREGRKIKREKPCTSPTTRTAHHSPETCNEEP